jgi:transcriptional regulator
MGTLVAVGSAEAEASPLPFRFHTDPATGKSRLEGHMDRRNPLWQHLTEDRRALVTFWGPNCYISPSRYETSPRVPTWLYLTLHIHGQATVHQDADWLDAHLHDLAGHLEPSASGWALPQVADYKDRLISGITGVTIEISKMTAQIKLAQQNTDEDRRKLYTGLRQGTKAEQAIADQMEKFGMVPDGV